MRTTTVIDKRFRALVLGNAGLEKLFSGLRWGEGPVYFGDGDYYLCSDIPNDRMLQWAEGMGLRDFRKPSNYSNGNARDRQGRLVSCEHGGRRVTRTEYDGSLTVLAERHKGGRLNSPNDLAVKSDGSIWFTDPIYGIKSEYEGFKTEREQDGCFVYRIDPGSGALEAVLDDFSQPNGLAFSPDESKLYVADTGASEDPAGPRHIRVFELGAGGRPRGGRVFAVCEGGLFDGFRFDTAGNLWTSAGSGVSCYASDGTLLGRIEIEETVTNLCFGGPKRNRLFITAQTSVYAMFVNAAGAGS